MSNLINFQFGKQSFDVGIVDQSLFDKAYIINVLCVTIKISPLIYFVYILYFNCFIIV